MLGDTPLALVAYTKLLGVIFDKRLTWTHHIDELLTKCKKVLSILKCLAGTDWGGQPKQMLQLYRALVRSRLEYGCQVYGSASPSVVNRLDTIQATGLRLCLGVPRTTPNEALQVEAGELPLDLRREQLSAQYRVRSLALPDAHPLVEEFSFAWHYFVHQRTHTDFRNPPFLVRTNETLDELTLRQFSVESSSPAAFPPWHLKLPEVSLDLHQMCPKTNNPPVSKAIATEYVEKNYSESLNIYTDGSKTPDGDTGAAFVVPELKISKGYKLPVHVSVFTCELIAILMSLFWIQDFQPLQVTIFTDSLSALQAFLHFDTRSRRLIHEIVHVYTTLVRGGTFIRFVWVPSHVGLFGNELADRAAKAALHSKEEVMVPHSVGEIGCLVKRHIMSQWQRRWDQSTHG